MNNIELSVLGSSSFSNILSEFDFNNIINSKYHQNKNNKNISVKILFAENLNIKVVKNTLLENELVILLLKQKDYIKKNHIKLFNFQIYLELPIELLSFKEILNILVTKYNFSKKSKIIIKDYEIDSNERSISKNDIKIKLTEKELELILALKNNNGLNKSYLLKTIWKHSSDLDSHAFETHLHRLRKKIYKTFDDDNFIIEKNSLYYLIN
jgi:DNA-binding response OmpR family regulator